MLRPYGFDCVSVPDKQAALDMAAHVSIALFVIDMARRGTGGAELDAFIQGGGLGANPPPTLHLSTDSPDAELLAYARRREW